MVDGPLPLVGLGICVFHYNAWRQICWMGDLLHSVFSIRRIDNFLCSGNYSPRCGCRIDSHVQAKGTVLSNTCLTNRCQY